MGSHIPNITSGTLHLSFPDVFLTIQFSHSGQFSLWNFYLLDNCALPRFVYKGPIINEKNRIFVFIPRAASASTSSQPRSSAAATRFRCCRTLVLSISDNNHCDSNRLGGKNLLKQQQSRDATRTAQQLCCGAREGSWFGNLFHSQRCLLHRTAWRVFYLRHTKCTSKLFLFQE